MKLIITIFIIIALAALLTGTPIHPPVLKEKIIVPKNDFFCSESKRLYLLSYSYVENQPKESIKILQQVKKIMLKCNNPTLLNRIRHWENELLSKEKYLLPPLAIHKSN